MMVTFRAGVVLQMELFRACLKLRFMKYSNIVLFFLALTIFSLSACKGNQTLKLADRDSHAEIIKAFQHEMNEEYASEDKSPLDSIDRVDFTELDFFPTNVEYQVLADFVRTPEEKPFAMKTSTDRTPIYIKYAEATFLLRGEKFTLSLYRSPSISKMEGMKYHLFLPFTDLTNGNTSYGGGRYIDLTIPKGNKIIIDFNKAYNPYCCYSDRFSCPVPPRENFLDAEIRAGVMAWEEY